MDENQIKGTVRDVLGKVKDGAGGLTGDTSLQAEGKVDQVTGKFQSRFGKAQDRLGDVAGSMADKAADVANRTGASLRDATGMVADASVRAGWQVGHTVTDQPLLSLIGVAAIGYAIGFLIHSPMSPLAQTPKTRWYSR